MSGAGGPHEEVIQVSYVGGGGGSRYMCNVTDWYELIGGEWVYQETTIDWNSCAWE